ncbi:MAG: hypothetical protein WD766_12305 [Gemmatimonadota bacterium]
MKKAMIALLAVTLYGSALSAQSPAEVIEAAVGETPNRFPGTASLIRWNPDHTYETIREGTNNLVCFDRSDERARPPFAAQCTHIGNLERVTQNRRFRAETNDTDGENARIAAAEADGTRVQPVYGSIWLRMDGADAATARLHGTVAVPGATAAALGLPDNGADGVVWLMDGGTSAAHLMIPGR